MERRGKEGWEEVENLDDLSGLCKTRPLIGW